MSTTHTTLVYLGANAHQALEEQLRAIHDGIKFVESAVYPERKRSPEADARLEGVVVSFDSELCAASGEIRLTPVVGCNQLEIIGSVMDDKLLPLLWTRFSGGTRWRHRSEVKRYELVYSLAKSAIAACRGHRPKAVVFSYEPHMLPMYVFKKVCEALGIPTYTMVVSPFNWRMCLEAHGADCSGVRPAGVSGADGDGESVARFIEEKRSDYSIAKPFYEKRTQRLGPGRRLMYTLRANGWKPHKVIMGGLALSEYRRLTTPRTALVPGRYVCLFLQLQPEQTTLPDGGLFVHHLFAIQSLYAAASELGLSLVVREHPATFETAYNATWRPRDFYRTIQAIGPGIHFDELEADPYALIKNASAVAAITGTVLLEGLLLGRPAIAFGKHPLRGYAAPSFVDRFDDEQDLKARLGEALEQSGACVIADIEKYLHRVYPTTFGPAKYDGNAQMSLERLRQARYTALRQIMESITTEAELVSEPAAS